MKTMCKYRLCVFLNTDYVFFINTDYVWIQTMCISKCRLCVFDVTFTSVFGMLRCNTQYTECREIHIVYTVCIVHTMCILYYILNTDVCTSVQTELAVYVCIQYLYAVYVCIQDLIPQVPLYRHYI